jgi:hypothetical protein
LELFGQRRVSRYRPALGGGGIAAQPLQAL